jgi:hypothetical protein
MKKATYNLENLPEISILILLLLEKFASQR